jgi:hypothetical protein
VLYWYAADPITTRVDVVIRDERAIEPLLEVQLPLPVAAGVNAIRLADHGAKRLEPGTNYQWFVSLVPDPARRSKDVTVGGWIRFEPAPEALEERLAKAGPERAVFVYAENGFWYDAIDAVSSQIAAAPDDADARAHRAALLDQVDLGPVANHDRGSRGARAQSQLLISRKGDQ